ncbi:MAG: hypothetical protein ACLSVD_11745 [Eggerthellaceae bacterium]
MFDPSALKELPYGFVAPCLIFVYFGIICVKALTAMQIGISVGALSNPHLVVTAAAGLVICMAQPALFRAKAMRRARSCWCSRCWCCAIWHRFWP